MQAIWEWLLNKVLTPIFNYLEKSLWEPFKKNLKPADKKFLIPLTAFYSIAFIIFLFLCISRDTVILLCISYIFIVTIYSLYYRKRKNYPTFYPNTPKYCKKLFSCLIFILIIWSIYSVIDLFYSRDISSSKGFYVAEFNGDCNTRHCNKLIEEFYALESTFPGDWEVKKLKRKIPAFYEFEKNIKKLHHKANKLVADRNAMFVVWGKVIEDKLDKKTVCYRITVSEKESPIIRERTLRVVDNNDFKILGKETQFITKFIGAIRYLNDAKITKSNKTELFDKALNLFREADAALPTKSNDDEVKYNRYQVLNHKAVTLFKKHRIEENSITAKKYLEKALSYLNETHKLETEINFEINTYNWFQLEKHKIKNYFNRALIHEFLGNYNSAKG